MTPTHDVATIRKVAFLIGSTALAVAAFMAFSFGWTMSAAHACLLGLLTLSGSIIFPYAGHLRSTGNRAALTYVAIGLAFLGAEYFSHIGYTIGRRVMNTEQTTVENAAYKIKQDSVGRNAELLSYLKQQLDELKAQNAWATSVSADGLRGEIPAMDEAIRQEADRGGCGPICLSLKEKKAVLLNRIGVVEKLDGLTERIAATQRLVNAKESEATHAAFRSSPVVAQTSFVAQLATLQLDPGRSALTWTQIGIGAILALVTTFLAPAMFSIAWGPLSYASSLAEKLRPKDEAQGEFALASAKAPLDIGGLIKQEIAAAMKTLMPDPVPQHVSSAPPGPDPHLDVHLHSLDAHGMLAALKRKLEAGEVRFAAA